MSKTAVILAEGATPASLTEFKDALSNSLVQVLEPWSVECKTYRPAGRMRASAGNNGATNENLPANDTSTTPLHCITFAHHGKRTVMVRNGVAMATSAQTADIAQPCAPVTGPSLDPLDVVLAEKLANLWHQRQVLRGDVGDAFELEHVIVRAVNLFSPSGFKGLLIELQSRGQSNWSSELPPIENALKDIGIQGFKSCVETIGTSPSASYICDLAFQYVHVLES